MYGLGLCMLFIRDLSCSWSTDRVKEVGSLCPLVMILLVRHYLPTFLATFVAVGTYYRTYIHFKAVFGSYTRHAIERGREVEEVGTA